MFEQLENVFVYLFMVLKIFWYVSYLVTSCLFMLKYVKCVNTDINELMNK